LLPYFLYVRTSINACLLYHCKFPLTVSLADAGWGQRGQSMRNATVVARKTMLLFLSTLPSLSTHGRTSHMEGQVFRVSFKTGLTGASASVSARTAIYTYTLQEEDDSTRSGGI
jgi:hypothetical protein